MGEIIKRKLLFLSLLLISLLSISFVSADSSIDDSNLAFDSDLASDSDFNDSDDLYNDDILEDDLSNNGFEKNADLNKLSSNSLGSNELNSNELGSNELNSNGLGSNELGSNSLSSNSLNSNSLSSNSLSSNSLSAANSKNSHLYLLSEKDWKIYADEEEYSVQLLDDNGKAIYNGIIYITISSSDEIVEWEVQTDRNGIASVPLDLTCLGLYTIDSYFVGSSRYNPSNKLFSKVYVHRDTQITFPKSFGYAGDVFTVNLYSDGEPISNQRIKVTLGSDTFTQTTDSNGAIKVKMPNKVTTVYLSCNFSETDSYYGSFLSTNLPVYKKTFTVQNTYALLRNSYFKVTLKGIDGKILSNHTIRFVICDKDYYRSTDSKGVASIKIGLGRGEYRIKYYYDGDGVYGPASNYTDLNVVDPSGQYKMLLNVKSSASVSKYLSGGGYATITSSIKKLANSITKKYKTKLEKAVAVFNYVRDNLDYQYYYNTRKGAAKTLKTKSGNCCDHANLLVALSRAAGLPARYSNSKYCVFNSGLRSGHVWAQIYVDGTWYSADATSYRNTLGHVANWNTKTNRNNYYFRNLPF